MRIAQNSIQNNYWQSVYNLLMVLISLLGGALLAFLTQVILGRVLSIEEFGVVTTSMAIVAIVASLVGFGLPSFWLLSFGKEGWEGVRWIAPSLWLCIILLPLSALGLWSYGSFISTDFPLTELIIWIVLMVILQVLIELLGTKYQLEGAYKKLSVWQLLAHTSRFSVAILVASFGWQEAEDVILGYAGFAVLLSLLAGYALSGFFRDRFSLVGHGQKNRGSYDPEISPITVLQRAWPFASTAFLVMIYGRIEIVLLGSLSGVDAAAIFGVSIAFLLVAYLVPQGVFQKFLLPKIHRWYNHDHDKFVSTYQFGCGAMALLGLSLSVCTYFGAAWLVPLVFGEKYSYSGELLTYLSICIFFRFVATSVGSSLVSRENTKRKVGCQLVVAIVTLVVATLSILYLGVLGAVLSKIISEALLLVLYIYTSTRYVLGKKAWSGWTLKVEK